MENLGLTQSNFFGKDQSQPGSFLDTVLQFTVPGYGILRTLKALEDDKYAPGTIVGFGKDMGGLFGGGSTSDSGILGGFGSSGYGGYTQTPDYGYHTYNFGGEDVGMESPWTSSDENSYASEIGVSDYGGWSSQDESDYADEVGVSDW